MLSVQELTKVYRKGVHANDGISLSVDSGEVFGLLGHNGAGKTTLVNQIIGLVKPTAGVIFIAGIDAVAHPSKARELCSVQAQAQVPITGLTPRQAIELIGRLRGGKHRAVRERTSDLADALNLVAWLDTPSAQLSGGVLRLVAFCAAAVAPGRVVIFDEPTNDVDPVRRRLLWQQVRQLANDGAAVVLVTHNVLEAERAVDRLAIIDRGRVVASGTPAALKAGLADELRLEIVWEPEIFAPDLPRFIKNSVVSGRRLLATVRAEALSAAVAWAEEQRRCGAAEEFSLGAATLEDVYIQLVGRGESSALESGSRHSMQEAHNAAVAG